MEERAVRRAAALAGFAFVVFLVGSIVLTFGAPMPDKSTAKILDWFADHRQLVYTSGVLGGLSTVAFLLFLGYLYHAAARVADGARAVASIALTSGIATVTIATMSALPYAALAATASRPGGSPSDDLVHMLDVLNGFGINLIGFGLSVFLLAVGLLLAQGVVRPRWATWVAYAGAVANLIGSAGGFYVSKSGKGNPLGFLGLLGLILFLVTMWALSTSLLSEVEAPA
jgi:hypothetical protein